MLKTLLIFLLSLILAVGATFVMYEEEVDGMIQMGQDKIDEIINGEKPEPDDGDDEQDELKVESIALDTTNVKLVFNFSEEFTAEGLKVTATLEDGSTKDVALADCKIISVDTTKPGTRQVIISYQGKTARYEVTVNAKVIPPISETPLVEITAPNDSVPYRVEAELIDMAISGTIKAEGIDSFVAVAPEGADITSGDQYLTGFGVAWNYFGFTFTAAETYEDVIIVLRVANSTAKDIDAGIVKMYLNYAQDENGNSTGAIALDGFIIEANGAGKWTDIVLRNVTIPAGTNTLTFETQKDNAFDIDYVDFYVGMRYINSVVEINDTTTIVKDLENFDTEKAFTRSDVANAHGLKDGQLFVEKVSKESPGCTTNGGTSVGAIGKGSQMSTTIRLAQDSTVRIKFKASSVGKGAYNVADNWNFYIDGVKLTTVEVVNIEGGDSSAGLWWDWKYTNVGEINLTAGDHFFLLEVHGTDCNVDTVEFEIVSLGSFDESGVDLEDMVQPEEPPVEEGSNLVINGEGEFVFEAEDLDISDLTPSEGQTEVGFETPSGDGPATSGGQSLGKAGGGSASFTFTLEDKATIQILGRLAHAHGGAASTFMSAKLGDTELALTGDLPVGVGNLPYWNWADIPFGGELELEAGTYTLTVTFLKNPNVDCFKIKVLSYGEDAPFATIEAETFDNEGVVTRQDMIDAGRIPAGEYMSEEGNGATCICGFTAGTYFKLNLNLEEAKTLEMFLVGATDAAGYDVSTKLSLKVNGVDAVISSGLLTGSGDKPYWDWQTVSLGVLSLNAGDNEIIITILDGHPNLDKVFFEEVESGGEGPVVPEHSCESVCAECGKCLDAECAEAACADKCAGHVVVTPDLVIEGDGEFKFEAENVDKSTLVLRADFAEAGRIQFTEPWNNDFGSGECLMAFTNGSKIVLVVEVKEAATLALSFRMSHYEEAVYDFSNITYTFAGQTLTPVAQGDFGHREASDYWKWVEVSLGEVAVDAGVYTFEMNMVSGGNHNLDYFKFATVSAPAHECESVCAECGKCTDAECAEAACESKCAGHVVVTPDITITDASNSYKAEAEALDISTLIPQTGFETPKVESFTGGQGLGGIAGGYQTFIVTTEKNVTVALKIAFAKYEGGSILTYVTEVSVNGEALTLTDGQIAPGTDENKWWNVSNVQVATIDLVAGETYTFQIGVNSGNLDGYVLEVVENVPAHECESACTDCGKCTDGECAETACESKCAGHDVVISANTTYTLEAENWPQDNMSARQDLINANHPALNGNRLLENNGTTIGGMAEGSYVSFNVYVKENSTVAFVMKAAHSLECVINQAMTLTVDGVAVELSNNNILGSGSAPWFDWSIFTMGQANLSAGEHTIVLTFVEKSPNLDYLKLDVVSYGSYADADVSVAASGTTKYEIENIDCAQCLINTRSDFVGAVGAGNCGKGSGRIYGYDNGSIFRVYVNVESACTLEIKLAGFGGTALNEQQYYFGGVEIIPAADAVIGSGAVAEGVIGQIAVSEAGVYCFEFTSGVNTDLDYVSFTVVE